MGGLNTALFKVIKAGQELYKSPEQIKKEEEEKTKQATTTYTYPIKPLK